MEMWNASMDEFSSVISFENPAGPDFPLIALNSPFLIAAACITCLSMPPPLVRV